MPALIFFSSVSPIVYLTVAFSVRRLTLASRTPGSALIFFSTLATHDAQCIPLTKKLAWCSINHQLFACFLIVATTLFAVTTLAQVATAALWAFLRFFHFHRLALVKKTC